MGEVKLEQGQLAEAEALLISSLQRSWAKNMPVQTSFTLIVIAELSMALGHLHYGLTLLSFLQHYSGTGKRSKAKILELLESTSSLAVQDKKRLQTQGKTLSIEDIIRSVLTQDLTKRFRFWIDD